MGLFDRFKKKPDGPPGPDQIAETYAEYIRVFIAWMAQGNFAPIAAYQDKDGKLTGQLYMDANPTYSENADQVVGRMRNDLTKRLAQGLVSSYAVLYHSASADGDNPPVCDDEEQMKAIILEYAHHSGGREFLPLPYQRHGDSLDFMSPKRISAGTFRTLLTLPNGHPGELFTDRIELQPAVTTNAAGIKMTLTNQANVAETWSGIFGFESYQQEATSSLLQEEVNASFRQAVQASANGFLTCTRDWGPLEMKSVVKDNKFVTVLPQVKTDVVIPTETTEINEWVHVQRAEAMVHGRGRDIFGIKYFATDYAENQERYQAQPQQESHLTGILMVLDQRGEDKPLGTAPDGQPITLSPDFAGYTPTQDHYHKGFHDFIGILTAHQAHTLPLGNGIKGHIVRIKLIHHEEIADCFTIDMWVNEENMRFKGPLQVGMRLTGCFQLLGRLA